MDHEKEASGRRAFVRAIGFLGSLILVGIVAYTVGFESATKKATGSFSTPALVNQALLVNTENPHPEVDFGLFWKVWNLVKEKHIDGAKLDANKMVYGAINGMLSATGDPYTTFFSPEENREFQEKISGNFEGIGAEIGIKDNILTIVTPLDDSPASKAGLRAGDRIFKVNDEDTTSLTVEQAVQKIRGPKGTSVKLTIFREGEEESRDITVVRDVIQIKSVKVDYKDGDVAVIRMSQFGETTGDEFDNAVQEILTKKSRGLVIDLRNNPGGLLNEAVRVSSRLISANQTVVIEENALGKQEKIETEGGDKLSNLPAVVLINEGSASAAEILAGALKDDRGDTVTLLGEKSFGKGSVQQLMPVTKDTSVKITVAHWLTPSGKQINKQGIAPDVEVKRSADDYKNDRDPQLDRALEIVKEKLAK